MAEPATWGQPALKVPTLAIFAATYGGNGLDVTKAYLPDLQFLNVPGTGHFLMVEKPAEFMSRSVAASRSQSLRGLSCPLDYSPAGPE